MIPSGYVEWCDAHELNAYHPETWTDADRAMFRAWRLERFRAKWRWLRDRGDLALRVAMWQRDRMLADVRADLDAVLGPVPTRAWRTCPCHRQRFYTPTITPPPEEAIDDDDVAVWRARDRAARMTTSRRLAVALAYLDTFRPKEDPHERTEYVHAGPPRGALESRWPESGPD